MTRAIALVAALLALGCGKYGPPVRASERAEAAAVSAPHAAATCDDPEHEHGEEATP